MRNGKIVLVDAPMETLTNALIPVKGYNFSVKFSADTYDHDLEGFRNDMGILFDYRIDPPFVRASGTIYFEVKGHETIYFFSQQYFHLKTLSNLVWITYSGNEAHMISSTQNSQKH